MTHQFDGSDITAVDELLWRIPVTSPLARLVVD
jgi:hypothetical protein